MSPTDQFAALAQDTRLAVFRLLIRAGTDGLPATEIANTLNVRQNLMSTHLAVLKKAGLTTTERRGRHILHRVDMAAVRSLLSFLLADCCQGRPEDCEPLIDAAMSFAGKASMVLDP